MINIFNYTIKEITKDEALKMVKEYHYSSTLPKINKHYLGFFLNDRIVGVVTLGLGTRPKHTIKKIFPNLDTKDYYEIGRMCMIDEMPKNSESQMLSQLIKYIKENYKDIKVLFTWADGMLNKPGYVYQAANFLYAGYTTTDIYLYKGIKIHPRQTKKIFGLEHDPRVTVRPTLEQLNEYGIKHYKGMQIKYIFFLCDKTTKKKLMREATIPLTRDYLKGKDLKWKVKNECGKWIITDNPPLYKTDTNLKDECLKELFNEGSDK